ncbi:outer membrane beta-barrel protein [Proteiniphilum saccharofermentans]|uniref:outer membrane beta-barrel protein n=1 Tax=Proteiniphilum saccharofermentans TaxID=1642647 RepID=UPI0028AD13DD|nr:outer membrane beta-barrel protein [Proteiniphilum saccharofermentans]
MKRILSTLFVIFFILSLQAQSISGIVADEENNPLEFVNVALFTLPDSALITGTVSDQNGEFTLNLNGNSGKDLFLQLSFIGYKTKNVEAKPQQTIVMEDDAVLLGEVVVKGDLPKIRLRNDALVTTVQNSVLSKAGTGNDVLKRLPLLTGDKGVFSVFGKGDAKIFINNREMRDESELDNLNSEDIKEVEIITNPGAQYDASVKAVIRITTVKKAGDGFSFDVRSSYWQSQNSDLTEQFNLNYRKNGWDVFGTFYYNRNAWIQDSKIRQNTFVDTLWTQENTLYITGVNEVLRGIAGVNYEISPKHYTGIKYTLSGYPPSEHTSTLNSTVLADGVFYDEWNSIEKKNDHNKPAHRINAYYNGTFGDLNIDFNADVFADRQQSNSSVTETSQEYDDRTVNSENNVKNRLVATKLILSYPVLGGKFSLGNENTDTHREDDYRNEENIVAASNTTIKERNNSFFVEYSRSIPIGQLGVGLRYENVRSDYFSNDVKMEEQSRRYDQWFPNLSFSTKLKEVNLQASYTAKTKRPSYRQLSSNVFYGNRFLLQTGNPYLKPSVIHDVTLVSTWKFVQFMASYKNEKDAVIYWTEQMEENPAISVLAYRNLERLPNFTAFLTLSPTFGVWSPQLSGGFIKQWVTITSNNKPVKLNKPLPIASLNNSFRFPNEFILTLDANYQGKGDVQNVYLTEHRLRVNLGVTKSFYDNRLRVELKGHDLFRGQKDGNLLYNDRMELYQVNRYDSREIELTVRYNFNSARSKYKGTGAGNAEINRL